MSAHASKLIKKYILTSDTDIDLLSVYAFELAPLLVDKNARNLARRCFLKKGLTKDQVAVLCS